MSAYWPKRIEKEDSDRGGRVSGKKDDATVAARERGETFTDESVADDFIKKYPPPCGEVLHISLFFDGTNNHLDWDAPSDGSGKSSCGLRLNPAFDDIPPPKDLEHATHSNVARLYRACPQDRRLTHSIYVPGVGTPFRELGEHLFSTGGKAFAHGLEERLCWAYLQILQRVYEALGKPFIPPDAPKNVSGLGYLFDDETVQILCQGKLSRPLSALRYTYRVARF